MNADRLTAALETARLAAREAGLIQKEALGATRRVEHKGIYDLVTDVDRRCEKMVLEILSSHFPEVPVLAEESSPRLVGVESYWVVDPLDGTTNYARGYPLFCCSIALMEGGRPALGVVYEPLRDEMFWARAGEGAFLNDGPLAVSDTAHLEEALLATGFPYDRLEQPQTNLDRFCLLTLRCRGVRRGGSAALDLCYTACGRLDGFWEIRLYPWDVCAGAFIVEQAGGRVTDLQGRPYDWSGKETVATNGRLHRELIEALALPAPHGRCFG
jgi:myo-inositol-1(or 4)-monophosphatase